MKTYHVQIANLTLKNMEELYEYNVVQLEAPENAIGQYNRMADAVETFSSMPEREKLVDVEPWKSRGMRWLNVDNYSVFLYS